MRSIARQKSTPVCGCVSVGDGNIIRGPRNIVVVGGSKATFTCITDSDTLCWQRNDEGRLLCNSDGCRESRFSVKTSPLNHHYSHSFMINSYTFTDAGRYGCYDCLKLSVKKTAHLVVLGTHCYFLLSRAMRCFCTRQ